MSRLSHFLAIGLDSGLAQKVAAAGYTLSRLRATSRSELARLFTKQEVELLWNATRRKAIPEDTLKRLVEECDWKCCLCWDFKKESPIIIHHIVEHSKTQDDSYDNLVILCLNHHAKAHSKWEISRTPWPTELIRHRKQKWVEAIADFKAGLRPAPGNEPPVSLFTTATAPNPPSTFTGRCSQLEALMDAFTRRQAVALAIQGMGGVGKTATAKKLALELMAHFRGGVFWAALPDSNGNPSAIFRNWAQLCGQQLSTDLDPGNLSHLLRGILTDRQAKRGELLVIIDDIREEWLESAKLIKQAIPYGASLLATTRNKAITAALDTEIYPLDVMIPEEALELLKAHSGLSLPVSSMTAADSLLKAVGHLPLAIELAGKRLALLSRKPGDHLNQLCQAVKERADGALVLPGHKGLAATFALTYEALPEKEQRFFRWLGALAEGPIQSIHVAKILDVDMPGTEQALDNLVVSALLSWGEMEGRYTLHPLLRQYAETLLNSTPEGIQAGKRHLTYYLILAEDNARETKQAHDKLDACLPDIMKAIEFAAQTGEYQPLNRIALALWTESSFLPTRGYMNFALKILDKAVVACRKLGDLSGESMHLGHLGIAYSFLGPPEQAIDCYNQALALCRQTDNRYDACALLGNLGITYSNIGEIDQAITYYQQALAIAAETGNGKVALDQLGNLGSAYRHLGRTEMAKKCYEQGITISREQGERLSEGNNLSNLGLIHYDRGNYGLAWSYIAEALTISQEIGDLKGEGNRLGHLGNILTYLRFPQKSIEYYEEALSISRQIGHRINEANWSGNLGNAYRYLGQIDKAFEYYGQALAISRELKNLEGQGIWLINLGITYRDKGETQKARQYFMESLEIFRTTKSRHIRKVEELLNQLDGRS